MTTIKYVFSVKQKFALLLLIISFMYFSIARGTTYEIFDLSLILMYVFTIKYYNNNYSTKSIYMFYSCIIIIAIFIFYLNITLRSGDLDYYISQDVYFDKNALIPQFSISISFIIIILYGYFGHGFFYTSYYFLNVWFSSFENFFLGLLPLGYEIKNDISVMNFMKSSIDQGTRWHPDVIIFINSIGFIGLVILCYFLGLLFNNINQKNNLDIFSHLIIFFIILQMISLPVGNFVLVSSSNRLILLIIIFYCMNKFLLDIKLNFSISRIDEK
jgi:hypothetical protein